MLVIVGILKAREQTGLNEPATAKESLSWIPAGSAAVDHAAYGCLIELVLSDRAERVGQHPFDELAPIAAMARSRSRAASLRIRAGLARGPGFRPVERQPLSPFSSVTTRHSTLELPVLVAERAVFARVRRELVQGE